MCQFVAAAHLTEYDLSSIRVMRFEFQPKDERVNMRLPRILLDAVQRVRQRQAFRMRFIPQVLETAVQAGHRP